MDFGDYKLSRYLLKKLALFAHRMEDGRFKWFYGEDDTFLMHSYARLVEQQIRANVGFYLTAHPDAASQPISNVISAFKNGFNEENLLESHLPGLSQMMTQLPNSRERFFSERMGIEALSRDLSDPNLFMTLNNDPRASPDVRRLLYELEYGSLADMDPDWFELNTTKFTELTSKYAAQLSIYLYKRTQLFLTAFLVDICGIAEKQTKDWRNDISENAGSYYFSRVEFTETRGLPHFHVLARLPHVLDTGLLGRIIHNGRVVRSEIKFGNIREGQHEKAWEMVEVGLLASRYATLFADSISTASFYTERMDADQHDPAKVIDLDKLRQEYVRNYKAGNVTRKTHPIMRRWDDSECDANPYIELAKVAAVSCMHNCIEAICGGDEKTGRGCRFSFPKTPLRCTVAAVLQVDSKQVRNRILD
jgi:ribosomal protein S17E